MITFETYDIEEVTGAFKKGIAFSADSTIEYTGTDMTVVGSTASVSFWYKPTTTDTFELFDSGQMKASQIGADFKFEFKDTAGATVSLTITDLLTLNTFQQISVRKSASTLQIYKNIALAGSTPSTETITTAASSYLHFYPNNGVMSDFKLYNKTLTDTELFEDYYNPDARRVDELNVYLPMARASANLVSTSLSGESSTIYGLNTTDFLFPVDKASVTENMKFSSLKSVMESGYEQRRSVWPNPLFEWSFNLREKLIDDIGDIVDFFETKKGITYSFGWRCPIDGRVYKVRFNDDTFARTVIELEAFTGTIKLSEVR